MTRNDRLNELRTLKSSRPERLLALYFNTKGQDESLCQLPSGIGFGGMIEAIIQHEIATGKIQGERPQLAGAS